VLKSRSRIRQLQKKKPLEINDLRKIALGELGLTLVQYYDKTYYELTAEIQGYNVRWEESWRPTRKLYTLIHNALCAKEDRRKEQELMPLPSEADLLESLQELRNIQESAMFGSFANNNG